ncbi:MAG: ATP-binding protein [Acidobacteriota bacterium]
MDPLDQQKDPTPPLRTPPVIVGSEETTHETTATWPRPTLRRPLQALRLSLTARLVVAALLSGLAVMALVSLVPLHRERVVLLEQYSRRATSLATVAAWSAGEALSVNDLTSLQALVGHLKNEADVVYALVLGRDEKPIAWSDPAVLGGRLPAAEPRPGLGVSGSEIRMIQYQPGGASAPAPVLDISVTVPPGDQLPVSYGTLRIGLSLEGMNRELSKTRLILLAQAELAVGLCALVAFLVARGITTPIRRLVTAAMRAAKGDLAARIRIQRKDEIGELARSFNYMVEQIRTNQRKIEELNRNLERKVKIRTKELEDSNRALKKAFLELKHAESQIIHSEKMASLGQVVAGVAHEINTPTSAINAAADNMRYHMECVGPQLQALYALHLDSGAMQVLHRVFDRITRVEGGGPHVSSGDLRIRSRAIEESLEAQGLDDQRDLAYALARLDLGQELDELLRQLGRDRLDVVVPFLRSIAVMSSSILDLRTSVNAIMRLVKALKTYSHLDQAEVTDVNIHDGLETTLTILHNQLRYGITVERNYGSVPFIRGNPSELNQIWTNILVNAIQAMKGNGKITIETGTRDGWVFARITDDGPGIPSSILGRVFDPFFTTKAQGEGTGLGLSICQQLAMRNRGRISVRSHPGQTCFEVMFPTGVERGANAET